MINTNLKRLENIKWTLLLIVLFTCSGISAQPFKVAIIPFTINTETDSSNLREGIYTILSSRIVKEDTILIIGQDEVLQTLEELKQHHGESQALMIGAKLKADYAIYGSIIMSGDNISILSKCIDISGKKPAVSFSKHIKDIEEIIPQINIFASQLNDQEFLKKVERKSVEDTVETGSADTLVETQIDSLKDTVEIALADTLAEIQMDSLNDTLDTTIPQTVQAEPPVKKAGTQTVITIVDSSSFSKEFWKSRTYPILMIGVAIGDVNKDGKVETIVLTSDMVQMYRGSDKKVIKLADIHKVRNKYPIGVDVADINNNGYPEIFVTSLDTYKNRVISLVLEYNGSKFITLTKNLSWYLRVVNIKDTIPMLVGQKHGKNAPYKGKVFQMKWERDKIKPDKQIIPSRGINTMGLAFGDLLNNGKNVVIAYDRMSNFKIINPTTGKKIWNNRDKYGGNSLYYQLEGSASIDREYLPMRMIIKDIDADGIYELVAVKNHEVTRNLLGKFKFFNKSHIEIFSWDGIGLSTKEKTETIGSFMRDFTFGDFDNDGKEEFVAAIVQKEGRSIFNKPQSSLVIYELNK